MEISIIVCDDDGIFREEVEKRVYKIMTDMNYSYKIFHCADGAELIECCCKHDVDIILADIDMPAVNGFEAAKELDGIQPDAELIFVTAHSELAYQAYDYKPFWFVDKADINRFDKVFLKLVTKIIRRKHAKHVVIVGEKNDIQLPINNVMYFDSYKNNIVAHMERGEAITFRSTVKKLYEQIRGEYFVMVQRGYIVNCRFIKQFRSKYVDLTNGERLTVTRDTNKLEKARALYGKYMREQYGESI